MPRGYRPVPLHLRQRRHSVRHREYARLYGLYTNLQGRPKRFSFQVRADGLSGGEKYKLIVRTIHALLSNYVPQHELGEVFSSFRELFRRTKWFRVRRIINYRAGVVYER